MVLEEFPGNIFPNPYFYPKFNKGFSQDLVSNDQPELFKKVLLKAGRIP